MHVSSDFANRRKKTLCKDCHPEPLFGEGPTENVCVSYAVSRLFKRMLAEKPLGCV
jgi:hypothetical protein